MREAGQRRMEMLHRTALAELLVQSLQVRYWTETYAAPERCSFQAVVSASEVEYPACGMDLKT